MASPSDVPSSFLAKPERMYLSDLKTLETMTAQFNPAEFEEVIKVKWARFSSPGLSHERMHYDQTENYKTTFELIYDALAGGGSVDGNLDARNFLMSLCYAKAGARTVSDGEASRVLFVWPGMISITAVIGGDLKFKHQRFNKQGRSTFFKVNLSLEEMRFSRLTSEEVRQNGTRRLSDPSQIIDDGRPSAPGLGTVKG
jgi:hypothetical protein